MEKSVHDLKRAIGLADRLDITLEGVKDDTFLAAYLLDPNRSKYELIDLAREAVGVETAANPQTVGPIRVANCGRRRSDGAERRKVLRQRILEKKLETIYSRSGVAARAAAVSDGTRGLKVDRATFCQIFQTIWGRN